ncbi:hypothetical protein BHE97_10880 [Aeromicrobium sp. PE09-221]|uniref:septum site-determining protein Ssd n=1 Tax=Aeromicrobium sp. PE09-221 TaxID=1898043 RepID=UPI000B3E5C06|nr:septum site-determining protein Ssd [Aeromicrobium sp. PE09-221]OUZ09232.1 hypothetical protein BHE97_10880 [Aeromicrobium sp. PE09-221]
MSTIGVISQNMSLIERGRRWGAAVGAEVVDAAETAAIRRVWRTAGAIVVGGDELASLAAAGLTRRDHVLVVEETPAERLWRDAVTVGAVGVFAPQDDDAVTGALTAALDGRGAACVLSVIGLTGGIGASTLALGCAQLAGRRGVRALAVDADAEGPGLHVTAGTENAPGLRWRDIARADGHVAARALAGAFPMAAGSAVLSFDPEDHSPATSGPVLSAVERGFDAVIADVPRHAASTELGSDIIARSVALVLLVPENVTGVSAARRSVVRWQELNDRCLVVSCAVRAGLGPGDVERSLGLPVLARLRRDRRLAEDVEAGRGPARSRMLRRVAGRVLDAVGIEDAS